ncbi:MAG: hypothetical protein JO246_07660 [Frankiaceae bacterium]|nr:hypothetical protein [Frankiaceae bacterium]MBV9870944.1 hypothetical protein [Frankiaceae bacterium]
MSTHLKQHREELVRVIVLPTDPELGEITDGSSWYIWEPPEIDGARAVITLG